MKKQWLDKYQQGGNKKPLLRDNTKIVSDIIPLDNSEKQLQKSKNNLSAKLLAKTKYDYYNPEIKKGITSGDKNVDFLYNNQWLMDVPLVGDYIKEKAYEVAKNSGGDPIIGKFNSNRKIGYDGSSAKSDKEFSNKLLDVYFGKENLPKSKYKPTSDYLEFLPSYSIKEKFDKLYSKSTHKFPLSSIVNHINNEKTDIDYNKPIYKIEEENSDLTSILGVDLGGHKLGIALDKEINLPYISISDAWDFEPKHYSQKWKNSDYDDPGSKTTIDKAYIQSSLMHKSGKPFKVYDRLYFDPNTKEYIPDHKLPKNKSKLKGGGIIEDDMGQYNHPGKITKINSNNITMKNVPYNVLGISDTGDVQMMSPEQEYKFEGNNVTEFPIMQDGGSVGFTPINTKKSKLTPSEVLNNIKNLKDQSELNRRKNKIETSHKLNKEKGEFSKEALANSSVGDKLRFFPNDPNSIIDEYLNPFKMVGDMADNIGNAFFNPDATIGDKALSVAVPLGVGALAGIGAKTTGQFVNNLTNPLAGIDLNKVPIIKDTYKINPLAFKPNPEAYYRRIGDEKGLNDIIESGLVRANPNVNDKIVEGTNINLAKKFKPEDTYYSKSIPFDSRYGPKNQFYKGPYMVESQGEPFIGKVNGKLKTSDAIGVPASGKPLTKDQVKIYKEDWLKGYKEVNKNTNNKNIISKLFNKEIQNDLPEPRQWLADWNSHPINLEKQRQYQALDPIYNQKYFSNSFKNEPKIQELLNPIREQYPFVDVSNTGVKKYKDIFKDKGFKEGIKQNLNSSGVSYFGDNNVYVKNAGKNNTATNSTIVHELTHNFENNGMSFNANEQEDLWQPFNVTPETYQNFLKNSPSSKKTYYTDPTEIHARMNEARYQMGLKPGEEFTEKHFDRAMKADFLGMGKYIKDKKGFINLMNDFYTPASVVGTAALLNKTNKKQDGAWLSKYQ